MGFVDFVENSTKNYIKSISKTERKKIGQFFTPIKIAKYMSDLFSYTSINNTITILDPGAGSGILSAALLDVIINIDEIKVIYIDLYENNDSILSLLNSNMEYIKSVIETSGKKLFYRVINSNFIVDNYLAWTEIDSKTTNYDIVICNPPYKKIGKDDEEAKTMMSIVYGQPNLYFLFMAMASKLLKKEGQFIFIVPRSFSSGLYFTKFRKWFFENMKITNLHLFVSRDSVFNCDNILQETIILKALKTQVTQQEITVTESINAENFGDITTFKVPYSTCIKNDDNSFMFFPTRPEDVIVLKFMNNLRYTLTDIGFRMKTGIVVDFRENAWMRDIANENTVPLFWAYNFNDHYIKYPVNEQGKPQYLINSSETSRLLMKNTNYVFIKRFTSKEEKKRIQCALYLKDNFSTFENISTENHLNFITKLNGEMTKEEAYGLFAVLNSSYMDRYFRILNGSTQVNANEINSVPFPSKVEVVLIGRKALTINNLNEKVCDYLIEEICGLQNIYSVI